MNFETFFDTTFDDQTLKLPKGDLKVAIKEFAREAFAEGQIRQAEKTTELLAKASEIARSPVFVDMPETRAVAIRNLEFKE